MVQKTVMEPATRVEVVDEVDVLVVGGGPAGVCAAVAAARMGAKTFLVERHGFLGGMWTAGMVLTLAGYNSWLRPYQRCVGGIPAEWLERATQLGGAEDNEGWVLNSDPEIMKLVADEMVLESGVRLLLHSWAARPIVEGGRVGGMFVENVDGRRAILARAVVDCTGNGDVIARSGAQIAKGDTLQPMTMPFRLLGVETDPSVSHSSPSTYPIGPDPVTIDAQHVSRRVDVSIDRAAMLAARRRGDLPPFGGPWLGGLDKDIVWFNTTRVIGDASCASDLTRAEIEGRADTQRLVSWFRKEQDGFRNARLLHTSTQIGVRETRRLVGRYVVTGDDVRSSAKFRDGIAVACWPIDIHPPDGPGHEMYVPQPYQIPYRALIPTSIDGVLAAGRCISADREALASIRVGATCGATGQAAGTAAALAAAEGISPSRLSVDAIRGELARQGAIIDPPE